MTTTTIDTANDVVTLVNVFTVEPENQRQLVDLLNTATEQVMRHQPGFVSANIHVSLDGRRVVNYAQWRSPEDFQSMLADSVAREHMEAVLSLAEAEPHLYEVTAVHHA